MPKISAPVLRPRTSPEAECYLDYYENRPTALQRLYRATSVEYPEFQSLSARLQMDCSPSRSPKKFANDLGSIQKANTPLTQSFFAMNSRRSCFCVVVHGDFEVQPVAIARLTSTLVSGPGNMTLLLKAPSAGDRMTTLRNSSLDSNADLAVRFGIGHRCPGRYDRLLRSFRPRSSTRRLR